MCMYLFLDFNEKIINFKNFQVVTQTKSKSDWHKNSFLSIKIYIRESCGLSERRFSSLKES